MEKELRVINDVDIGLQTRADGKKYIEFYAIVFNSLSRNMGGWYERILPEAVANADLSRWCAKKNHDINFLLGTSWGGTAKYEIDARGVKTIVEVGDSTIWQDTIKEIERGDLRSASFEFYLNSGGSEWLEETDAEGKTYEVRNVKSIAKITDQSPVVEPAYLGTEGIKVATREYNEYKTPKEEQEIEGETDTKQAENQLAIELELIDLACKM